MIMQNRVQGKLARINLHRGGPIKSLCFGKTGTGGRNNTGRVTAPHRGCGAKRKIRIIDTKRSEFWGVEATVKRLEYDPGRTGRIALVEYPCGSQRYVLAPEGLSSGDKIVAGDKVDNKIGNVMPLRSIPQGLVIHNVELHPGKGGQVARSAGAYARIAGRDGDYVILKMRSGELRKFSQHCLATIGTVSNADHSNRIIGKAGRNRWLGVRPSVRGIAKNPVDHAMGGRTNGGRAPCTWDGKVTRGRKTRSPNKLSNRLIVSRRPSA
jgi:large subunit ribosomal protein L2